MGNTAREAALGASGADMGDDWLDALLQASLQGLGATAPAEGPWAFLATDVASAQREVRQAYAQAVQRMGERLQVDLGKAQHDNATGLVTLAMLVGAMAIAIAKTVDDKRFKAMVIEDQQHAMARADRLHYVPDGQHAAWVWGHGPLVILVHGWNGRAAQLAPLAMDIAQRGFRCVAIDITGHGSSPGHRTAWADFIADIASLSQSLGQEVYAYIGHSAGGLAMMATRAISPRQFQASWEQLERGRAHLETGFDLLLFYDEADRLVAHGEGDRIQRWSPGSRLEKTKIHGHTKVLGAPELADAVGAFLLPRKRLAQAAQGHLVPGGYRIEAVINAPA